MDLGHTIAVAHRNYEDLFNLTRSYHCNGTFGLGVESIHTAISFFAFALWSLHFTVAFSSVNIALYNEFS